MNRPQDPTYDIPDIDAMVGSANDLYAACNRAINNKKTKLHHKIIQKLQEAAFQSLNYVGGGGGTEG